MVVHAASIQDIAMEGEMVFERLREEEGWFARLKLVWADVAPMEESSSSGFAGFSDGCSRSCGARRDEKASSWYSRSGG